MSPRYILAAFCLVLSLQSLPALAAKTDIVILRNGNAITGEVKSLDFGVLRHSTDSMGTVSVDWEDIVSVTSEQKLQIEITNGQRYYGKLVISDERFHIKVVTASSEFDIPTSEVIRMTTIEVSESFWGRLEGDLSLSLDAQKASELSTLRLSSDIRYRTREYLVGLTVNSAITDQPSQETTRRENAALNYQRFRGDRWFTDWSASWERNDELGIKSRYQIGGGLGRYVVQNNRHQFSLMLGIVATREQFTTSPEVSDKMEGRVQVRFLRRNLNPDSSLSFTSNVYPILDDLDRYRAETDLSFRHEVIDDLYVELSLYHSYLSDPPPGAETADYGALTSVGYSF